MVAGGSSYDGHVFDGSCSSHCWLTQFACTCVILDSVFIYLFIYLFIRFLGIGFIGARACGDSAR